MDILETLHNGLHLRSWWGKGSSAWESVLYQDFLMTPGVPITGLPGSAELSMIPEALLDCMDIPYCGVNEQQLGTI